MYRKFWFVNSQFQTFELTDKNYAQFLSNPSGLGFNKTIQTQRLGNVEYVVEQSYDMPTVSGDVLFYGNITEVYQNYLNLIEFLKYEPIQFFYLPPNSNSPYYIDCNVVTLEKGEMEGGRLTCPIQIYGNSLWKNYDVTTIEVNTRVLSGGKHYALVRPYTYIGTELSNFPINNNGTLVTGFVLEINGTSTNPKFTLTDENGVIYGIVQLRGTFGYVRINTNDSAQSVYLESTNHAIMSNPSSYIDFSARVDGAVTPFPKLKGGLTKGSFTAGNIDEFSGFVRVTFNELFVGV